MPGQSACLAELSLEIEPMPTPAEGDLFDPAAIAEVLDAFGDEAPRFAELFVGEGRRRLDRLAVLIAAENRAPLKNEAHALKGGAMTFGCLRLIVAARALEEAALSAPAADLAALLAATREAFGEVEPQLVPRLKSSR
jgi:HPt (histidine-containing phosphotransfer) domain-containing protein